MIGVDLFAGAGGMSLGAEQAGIDVRVAIEMDRHAIATYKHNHSDITVIDKDIAEVNKIPIREEGAPTVLFGGPPCRGFSTSNQRTRDESNPLNWLFLHCIRLAQQWEPDWIVFENVKGILETDGGRFFAAFSHKMEQAGYKVSYWFLNAADYGVPQNRWRVFILGRREAIPPNAPEPLTCSPLTVEDALSDLPELPNGARESWLAYRCPAQSSYARQLRNGAESSPNHLVTANAPHIIKRYRHVPPGGNWENIPEGLMENYADRSRCHSNVYHRLQKHEPSITVGNYRKNMLIHPTEDRGLSVREAARLQSFPDYYEFTGSIGFQQQQVGNAVPPLLSRAVMAQLIQLSGGKN